MTTPQLTNEELRKLMADVKKYGGFITPGTACALGTELLQLRETLAHSRRVNTLLQEKDWLKEQLEEHSKALEEARERVKWLQDENRSLFDAWKTRVAKDTALLAAIEAMMPHLGVIYDHAHSTMYSVDDEYLKGLMRDIMWRIGQIGEIRAGAARKESK